MQHRDIPKVNIEDDDLTFAPFALRVAQGILNYSQDETFILSLEGEWGSGKTTLINFIESKIKDKVGILHFNPWLITDINQVTKLFFTELMKIILSKSFDVKQQEDIKKYFKIFASLILPESLEVDIGIVKIGYKPKETLLDEEEQSLDDIKKCINCYLKKLDNKIVIVIDDIDRLTDKETEFIFRLIKGIADFDNLIYILLYDKNVVSKSLEKFKAENGQKYLEKIVQYPLSVPKPHKVTIKNLLFKELDEIFSKLDQEGVKYIFDEKMWNEIPSIINNYIKTVRDINQIVNIISFEYPIIAEDVNFTDFFIISLIKLKNYELYELIQHQPNNFFLHKKIFEDEGKEEKRITENFDTSLIKFHPFKDLLEIIFPIFQEYSYRDSRSYKNKYISDIYYFENYFSFSTADDKMSMQEYFEIKKLLVDSNYEVFKDVMLKVDKKQKSAYFLDMFYEFDEAIEKHEIENIFINTLKVSKELVSKDPKTMSLFDVSISYEQLGYDILIKYSEVDDFILNFYRIDREIEFKVKVNLLRKINKEIKNTHSDKKLQVSNETLAELNSIVKTELESIRFENMLNYSGIITLISSFDLFNASLAELGKGIENNMFKSSDNFFKVLNIFETYSIRNSKYKEHYISKEFLEKLIKLEVIEEYINELDKSTLLEEQNILLEYWKNNDKF